MSDRVYCYQGTDVLKNKLGIKDAVKLNEAECMLTKTRIWELYNKPIKGNFDLKHLQAIHIYIFQDIYEWAGELRTVDITKSNMFCNVKFVKEQANNLFGKLKHENDLKGLDDSQFVKKLAYYFGEINAIHPFREGNGRTQREFIRCICMNTGRKIRFENICSKNMIEANIKSFVCDYSGLEELLNNGLILEVNKKESFDV